ncbi:MAG: hypothetical protein ThorAB25_25400 [Candidatus Thorarchaeota archaeon AB_25]|nr:MAG: hypothetical protein ThorAB25_25400 [Candidatus Thorarchaeota archaeon AB_25]
MYEDVHRVFSSLPVLFYVTTKLFLKETSRVHLVGDLVEQLSKCR